MRRSGLILIAFGVGLFHPDALSSAGTDAALPSTQPTLTDRVEKRLIQFEMRVSRKGDPVSGLSAADFDIELAGKPLSDFTVDDMCAGASIVAARDTNPGSSLFYFDEPELTREGRIRAVEVARRVAPALLERGHDLKIVRNGSAVLAETGWTHDASEVFAALDRIASDPGARDYLRDAVDERDVERLIEEAASLLGGAGVSATVAGRQLPTDCTLDSKAIGKAINMVKRGSERNAIHAMAGSLRTIVNAELRRTGRDIARLRGAVQSLASRGSPKAVLYFADSLRSDPGRAMKTAFESISNWDPAAVVARSTTIAPWNADGAMQSLTRDAAAFGVRFYAVEGRGLTNGSDWVRTAQDTLASLGLETGGLSFVNGLQASSIADRIAADQACWYLVSFDPADRPRDRTLDLGIWPKERGLKVRAVSSVVIPGQQAQENARLVAANFGKSLPEDTPLAVAVYPVGGTDKSLQVMAQVTLPDSESSINGDPRWEVAFEVVSNGEIGSRTTHRVRPPDDGRGPVYQTTLTVPSGPYEIVASVRDLVTDSTRRGSIEGAWAPVRADDIALSQVALAQPQHSGVVVDGEVNPHGIVVVGMDEAVDPKKPIGIVTSVCIGGPKAATYRAERSIFGDSVVEFDPISLTADGGRCVQIRDMVAAGSLSPGRVDYVVRVLSGERDVAVQSRAFQIREQTAPASPIAAIANK